MPVEAVCPSCEGKFRLPDAAAGKKIRCPKCKGPLKVPPLTADPPAPVVAARPAPPAPSAPPAVVTTPPPAPAENLRSTWRTASQEPAPPSFEAPPLPKESPRKEPPKESPKPQPSSKDWLPPTPVAKKPSPPPVPVPPPAPITKPKLPELPPVAPPPAPAVDMWFLKGEDEETFGPVDRATLDAWHDEGRMTADSQLLLEGTEQWQWASEIYPDLEEPAPEPPAPAAPIVSRAAESSIHTEPPAATASSVVRRSKSKIKTVAPADDEDEEEAEEQLSPHSKPIAVLLGLTLGMFGIHRFYLGYVGLGLAMFFTFGGLLCWSITDSLRILFGHVTDSEGLKLRD
ncbi:NINE protein [Anatilimnocola floriformis]|uniref:NINE protein n=1 Tax=Anatilimnocola floriformis TaxID=2948575 RepID=UPI0020C52C04|nr:NINE protein [Anatilimnocola floriformis]